MSNDVRSWTNYWQQPPRKGGESKWCRTIENHSTFPVCCNKLSLPLWIRLSSKPGQSQACRFLGSCYEKSDKRHTQHNPQTKQDHGPKRAIFSESVTACGCGLYEATNDEIYLQIVWEAEVNFCNAFLYRGFTASESTLCWDNFSPNTREGYDHLLGKRILFFSSKPRCEEQCNEKMICLRLLNDDL